MTSASDHEQTALFDTSIAERVLAGLLAENLISAEDATLVREDALSQGVFLGAVLKQGGLVSPANVATVLEHHMGVPYVDLSSYVPEEAALALVPPSTALALHVLPLFEMEGSLTVAIGSPMDALSLDVLVHEIEREVDFVLADPASVVQALQQYYPAHAQPPAAARTLQDLSGGAPALCTLPTPLNETAPALGSDHPAGEPETKSATASEVERPVSRLSEPDAPEITLADSAQPGPCGMEVLAGAPPGGPVAIDMDCLADADDDQVARFALVILEDAQARGATHIELLPFKSEFFLVYRIGGVLEKVASASAALEPVLAQGFRHVLGLGDSSHAGLTCGRGRATIGGRALAVLLSAASTLAGERIVLSLEASEMNPRTLQQLGASIAEARALYGAIEHSRGMVLACAPLANGASATYYALLAHAASVGKTVFSIEDTVEYEIPAVAQIMRDPMGLSAASGIAAGLHQDVDIIAVDRLRSSDDVQMAVEAAAHGKLVLATLAAASIASGVRWMLDCGAEPQSLASVLTLGVAQRLVRLNCPHCSHETDGVLAARIPGAPEGVKDKTGLGCSNCKNSGFDGTVALYEVLPLTNSVRGIIGRAGTAGEIAEAALAAGMRPIAAAGLARVTAGELSAEELNRVIHFID